jgi:hypothetical protein
VWTASPLAGCREAGCGPAAGSCGDAGADAGPLSTVSVPSIVGRRPRRPTSPLPSVRALTYLARGPGTVIRNGGGSNDRLVDWTSSVTMTGGPGNDRFAWELTDRTAATTADGGPATTCSMPTPRWAPTPSLAARATTPSTSRIAPPPRTRCPVGPESTRRPRQRRRIANDCSAAANQDGPDLVSQHEARVVDEHVAARAVEDPIGPASRWTIGGQNPGETRRNAVHAVASSRHGICLMCRDKARKPRDLRLLAIQKVEGSSPFSGFEERPAATAFGAFQLAPRIGLGCRERLLV